MKIARKIDLPKNQDIRWMEEVLESGKGSFKIMDKGGNFFWLHDGTFSMKHNGITREIKKTKETVRDIFITRLERYQNFTYKDHFYYFHEGSWYRMPVEGPKF